jgi:hypothetical protein
MWLVAERSFNAHRCRFLSPDFRRRDVSIKQGRVGGVSLRNRLAPGAQRAWLAPARTSSGPRTYKNFCQLHSHASSDRRAYCFEGRERSL